MTLPRHIDHRQYVERPDRGKMCTVDERSATEWAEVLRALADPIRLRLVSIVAAAPAGEICACDLPTLLDRSQPTVSHHLSILVRAEILEREQRGKWAWFRVRGDRLTGLAELLTTQGR
jgi:ArsR family transcriptional regulator